jgi:hypothetical protein
MCEAFIVVFFGSFHAKLTQKKREIKRESVIRYSFFFSFLLEKWCKINTEGLKINHSKCSNIFQTQEPLEVLI